MLINRKPMIYLIILIIIGITSCTLTPPRLTYSNFSQIKEGMTEQEVLQILGEPTKVTSIKLPGATSSILGIDKLGGTNMIWIGEEARANIIFVQGKVKTANFTNSTF
jgi:hypothetical protein